MGLAISNTGFFVAQCGFFSLCFVLIELVHKMMHPFFFTLACGNYWGELFCNLHLLLTDYITCRLQSVFYLSVAECLVFRTCIFCSLLYIVLVIEKLHICDFYLNSDKKFVLK